MRWIPALLVGLFWATMNGLLFYSEYGPGREGFLSVPVQHVWRTMFHHGEPSDLAIMDRSRAIGGASFHPKIDVETGERALEFGGSVWVSIPGVPASRLFWDGESRLDRRLQPISLRLQVYVREQNTRIEFNWSAASGKVGYEIRVGDDVIEKDEVATDPAAVVALAQRSGIPLPLAGGGALAIAAPSFSATMTKFRVRGDAVEAFLVTVKQGETTLGEIYVNPLGQILKISTAFGVTLRAEEAAL